MEELMPLADRIRKSTTLKPQEKLIMGLLANEMMTPRELIDCLMSDPYDLTFQEVSESLDNLLRSGFAIAGGQRSNETHFEIDILLTFTPYWLGKV